MTSLQNKRISLGTASLISGLGLLIMVLTVPFAQFYIFPKLIGQTAVETAGNIANDKILFTIGIFLHTVTLICDVVVAWGLYIFLKPVHKGFSLLVAWFRLLYTAMYLVALSNLIKVLTLVNQPALSEKLQYFDQVLFYIDSFRLEWEFGLLIFGIYLCVLGSLVFKADYVPKIFGLLLLIAGLGYVISTVRLFFFPNVNMGFLMITFFGEIAFMFWLLIKGSRIKPIAEAN